MIFFPVWIQLPWEKRGSCLLAKTEHIPVRSFGGKACANQRDHFLNICGGGVFRHVIEQFVSFFRRELCEKPEAKEKGKFQSGLIGYASGIAKNGKESVR